MRRLVRNKLRSRAGASVTFALLLFLVCAVVGSVVLAAGTAASGRFSDLKEMDARYYSVTSAAELLKDGLSGKSVTVSQTNITVTTTVTPYVNGVAGTATRTETPTPGEPEYPAAGTVPRILADAAESLNGGLSAAETKTYTLTHSAPEGIDGAVLDVTVTRTLTTDGTMKLNLCNTGSDPYTLILTFSCEKDRRVDRRTDEATPTVSASSAENYTVTQEVTLTETIVSTYKWVLTDIQKAVTE